MSLDFEYDPARLSTLATGARSVLESAAVFRVEGPGALTCLQGLLTNDLDTPGDGCLVFGALLTPKGMIVADFWVMREASGFLLIADASARAAAQALLARSLPPRLAKVTDVSESVGILWCLGHAVRDHLMAAGIGVPEPGRLVRAGEVVIGAGHAVAPFALLSAGPTAAVTELATRVSGAGVETAAPADLVAARVLAGWPTLGREIDERTLPQEIRFEEIGGVSFTKGCYTGQETVARVHFRGHVNRTLRAVVLDGGAAAAERVVRHEGKEVGVLRTGLRLGGQLLALATVRREVPDGSVIVVENRNGRVIPLPVSLGDLRP